MSVIIKPKRSESAGAPTASDLAVGELALNFADTTIYSKKSDGTIVSFGGGVALTDLSIGTEGTASGDGAISYDSSTGVFTYTPPDLSSYLTSVAFGDLTSTPTTIAGYGITDAFDGDYSSLTSAPTNVSSFTNDSGYITGYTVTEGDVTAHEAALSITKSQVTDLATSDLDLGTNKILYSNVYSTLGDLPSASSYHGMFAHVHGTGKAYYAHAGSWVELANVSELFDGVYSSLTGTPSIPTALTDLSITDGTDGQVLTTDGAGSFTFADAGGGTFETLTCSAFYGHNVVDCNNTYSFIYGTSGPGGNFFVGKDAGINTNGAYGSGSFNTFIGRQAGRSNTTGRCNNFFGHQAGCKNTTGNNNNFFGSGAGFCNTTGSNNNFMGLCAGQLNTTGANNNFFGANAGSCNTTGRSNNFIGLFAGCSNTTGAYNNFIGQSTGRNNTEGVNNNFFGCQAGFSNTAGYNNNFFGTNAGYANTSGAYNNFFGNQAGLSNTTGVYNNFFGHCAGGCNTAGVQNNVIGRFAGFSNTTGQRNNFFGDAAGYYSTGSFNTYLGGFLGTGFATCSNHVFISDGAGNRRIEFNNSGAAGFAGANFGTAGQVLTSCGNAAAPVWADAGGGGVALTDFSVTQNTASGNGTLAYNNTNGVFTYTPPDLGSYLTSETTTTLTADSVNQKLVFTDETGTPNDVDLSWAVDDTNLARLTSGTVDANTGIATFTRDDATDFTVDFSALFDDTNLTRITSGTVSGNNLTLTRSDATTVVVDVTSLNAETDRYAYEDTKTFVVTVDTKDSTHPQFNNGSANGYKIDGAFAPFLHMVPGMTYRFDQSDASNSGHPLVFYYDENKTTSYTDGVTNNGTPGSAGAYTQIIVSDTTPSTLYYQCSVHSLMGWGANISTHNLTGLDTDDLTEGASNLYYTTSRFNTDFGNKSTSDLSEGTNLYHTTERARTAINATGDISYDSATGTISFNNSSGYLTSETYSTASELLTAIKTVDGASSGLEADLLDGQEGSYYLNYSNLSNTPTSILNFGITDGTAGQVLQTDGSGNFSFTTVSGGSGGGVGYTGFEDYFFNVASQTSTFGTSSGAHDKVQVFVNGAYLDDSDYTFNATTGIVTLTTAAENGDEVSIWAFNSTGLSNHELVTVDGSGNITAPGTVQIGNHRKEGSLTSTIASTSPTDIPLYYVTDYIGAKLIITVKDNVTGDTQISEALILTDPTQVAHQITTYGTMYTSANALATFDAGQYASYIPLTVTMASSNSSTVKVAYTLIDA